jgi:hypothetical protein
VRRKKTFNPDSRYPGWDSSLVLSVNRMSQEERSIFVEVTVSVILSQNFVCTSLLIQTISEIEPFHCTDEQHAMSSPELQSALMLMVKPETVRNKTHLYVYSLLVRTDTMISRNIDLSSWDTCIRLKPYSWSCLIWFIYSISTLFQEKEKNIYYDMTYFTIKGY